MFLLNVGKDLLNCTASRRRDTESSFEFSARKRCLVGNKRAHKETKRKLRCRNCTLRISLPMVDLSVSIYIHAGTTVLFP